MLKISTRLQRVTHNINTHRIQVHESVLCLVGLGVHFFYSAQEAYIDVTIDIRLVLLQ
jgi:hypothetical protein